MALKKKKTATSAYISLDPDDAEQGGLLNDCDVTVKTSEFTIRSKDNYTEEADDPTDAEAAALLWHIEIEPDEELPESAENQKHLYLSLGSLKRMRPSKDGHRLVPAKGSNAKGLSSSSNGFILMKSLKDNGFPMKKLADDCSSIEGLYFHLLRIPQPSRSGLVQTDDEGNARQRTVPTVHEIKRLPWEKGGKKKTTAKAKVKASAEGEDDDEDEDADEDAEEEEEDEDTETEAADEDEDEDGEEEEEEEEEEDSDSDEEESDEEDEDEESEDDEDSDSDLEEEAQAVVVEVLASSKYKKGIAKDKLYAEVFNRVKKNKNKKAILGLVQKPAFIKSGPWNVKGNTLTAA
jgi:hypothetical protein